MSVLSLVWMFGVLRSDVCRWGLWQEMNHEGAVQMNGICALINRPQRAASPLPSKVTRSLWPRRGLSPNPAQAIISDFQAPELWEINFCCLWATQSAVFCFSSTKGLRQSVVILQPAFSELWPIYDFDLLLSCKDLQLTSDQERNYCRGVDIKNTAWDLNCT